MAFSDENCVDCVRQLANTKYTRKEKDTGKPLPICPICALGEVEGSQSKYWETSQAPKPPGFRYDDDTTKYVDDWFEAGQKWVQRDYDLKAWVHEEKVNVDGEDTIIMTPLTEVESTLYEAERKNKGLDIIKEI